MRKGTNVKFSSVEAQPERNPCMPSPCGPNTYCRISGKRAICSCVENFIGDPKKGCRPECTMNSDCSPNKVCSKYQCKDPCSVSNVCGLGAVCICRDHNPTCVCREGFAGNPFVQCLPRREYSFSDKHTPIAGLWVFIYFVRWRGNTWHLTLCALFRHI